MTIDHPDRDLLGRLPAVDRVLELGPVREAEAEGGRAVAVAVVRAELARLRDALRTGRMDDGALARAIDPEPLAARVAAAARDVLAARPRPVINATGVVVHTNLGRSALSRRAAARLAETAGGYVDLEYDLDSGGRGRRLSALAPLMDVLFPGRGFLAVNNNAAAILLALRALSRGKDVIVSRGELVEIGGSFRVPDILAVSGARLREVGTTNRTRRSDYADAIGPRTGALLKVHTSNFRIVGFAEETGVADLAALARERGLPLIVDWGSGDLVDLAPLGIDDELPVTRILEAGADVVTFSGDKLLGGPQAGIAVGDPELIRRMARDPIARVCRLDRVLLAALHATLTAHVRGVAFEEIPTLAMLARTPEEIGARAERVRVAVLARGPVQASVEDGVSRTGGGSSPTGERPTRLLAIDVGERRAHRLERALRAGEPPVIARVHGGRVLIDLRTVDPAHDGTLAERLAEAVASLRR